MLPGSTSGVITSLLSILVASPDINATPIEINSNYLTLFTGLTISMTIREKYSNYITLFISITMTLNSIITILPIINKIFSINIHAEIPSDVYIVAAISAFIMYLIIPKIRKLTYI